MEVIEERAEVRFAKVLARRTQPQELLALFERLGVSDKFSDAERPGCFVQLVEFCCQKLPNESVPELVKAIGRSRALSQQGEGAGPEKREAAASKVVRRQLLSSVREGSCFVEAIDEARRAGVVQDEGHFFSLAIYAGLQSDFLDKTADAVHRFHEAEDESIPF